MKLNKEIKANTSDGPDANTLERTSGILDRLYRLDAGQVRIGQVQPGAGGRR